MTKSDDVDACTPIRQPGLMSRLAYERLSSTASSGVTHPRRPSRYAHVDALRALAVLIVVFSHAGLGSFIPGSSGVTIFFVISGFVITTVLLRERKNTGGFSPSRFYMRRLFKLMPPFVLIIVLPTLVYSLFRTIDWHLFLSQVFFGFNFFYMNGVEQGVLPGSGIVWSLAIEEQFYIVFALYWLMAAKKPNYRRYLLVLSAIICSTSLALRVAYFTQGTDSIRFLYGTDTRADSIAIGVLAAIVFAERESGQRWVGRVSRPLASNWSLLAVVCLFGLSVAFRSDFYKDTLRFTVESSATAVLILYGLLRSSGAVRACLGSISNLRIVQVIGLSSYSIYLIHLIVFNALADGVGQWPLLYRVALLVTAGVLPGILVWRLIEEPALHLRRKLMHE